MNCVFNPLIFDFFSVGSFSSEFKIRSGLHNHKIILVLSSEVKYIGYLIVGREALTNQAVRTDPSSPCPEGLRIRHDSAKRMAKDG
jgi:hypothetical protein